MDTTTAVSIPTLTPAVPPPFDHHLRAIVTLSWPYSSSTKQCALLLAEPDFRLRTRRGQVRVRFFGASAEAVARARLGIGDEVLLGLEGATWARDAASEETSTRTPGKSVEGDLVYGRRLKLRAGGAVLDVDADVSAEVGLNDDEVAMPLSSRATNGDNESRLIARESASNGLAIYSSPAFMKKARLSGGAFLDSMYDPFVGDLDAIQPNKKQRVSFGGRVNWRYAETLSSPTEERSVHSIVPDSERMVNADAGDSDSIYLEEGPSTAEHQQVEPSTLPPPSQIPIEHDISPFNDPGNPALSNQSAPHNVIIPLEVANSDNEHVQGVTQPAAGFPPFGGRQFSFPSVLDGEINDQSIAEPDESNVEWDTVRADLDDDHMLNDFTDIIPEDDIEEVIEPSETGGPNDDESGDEFHEQKDDRDATALAMELPQEEAKMAENDDEDGEQTRRSDEYHASTQPRTPVGHVRSMSNAYFGLDGASSDIPPVQETPPSEKEKIMAQTFRSLFGFAKLPDAEPRSPQRVQEFRQDPAQNSPTPASRLSGDSQIRVEAGNYSSNDNKQVDHASSVEVLNRPFEPITAEEPGQLYAPISQHLHRPIETPVTKLESNSDEQKNYIASEMGSQHKKEESVTAGQSNHHDMEMKGILYDASLTSKVQETDRKPELDEGQETQMAGSQIFGSTLARSSPIPDALPASRVEGDKQLPTANIAIRDFASPMAIDLENPETTAASLTFPADSDEIVLNSASSSGADDARAVVGLGETAQSVGLFSPHNPASDESELPFKTGVQPTEGSVSSQDQSQLIEDLHSAGWTAPVELIELDSSSAVSQKEVTSEELTSQDWLLDAFIEPDKFASSNQSRVPHSTTSGGSQVAEVKSAAPELRTEDSISSVVTERREEDTNVTRRPVDVPTYPSLPLSPSYSQPSQEINFGILPQHTATNDLPPTPQLTQVSSSALSEKLIEEEPTEGDQQASQTEMPPIGKGFEAEPPMEPQQPVEDQKMSKASPKRKKKTPAKKAVNTRLSIVPDVLKEWFSPRRSSADEAEKATDRENEGKPVKTDENHTMPHDGQEKRGLIPSTGLATALGYFTPLSQVDQLLNPSSQQAFSGNTLDVLAVVTYQTKQPQRAKGGPRDFFTFFRISDSSIPDTSSIRVEAFRPWMATLPVAQVGDVVLLRSFTVKSRKRQSYLLSTDTSAWCVWRYADSSAPSGESGGMRTRRRTRQSDIGSSSGGGVGGAGDVREEIKGPPVELGDEERQHAQRLRAWWLGSPPQAEVHEDDEIIATNASPTGRMTRSQAAKM